MAADLDCELALLDKSTKTEASATHAPMFDEAPMFPLRLSLGQERNNNMPQESELEGESAELTSLLHHASPWPHKPDPRELSTWQKMQHGSRLQTMVSVLVLVLVLVLIFVLVLVLRSVSTSSGSLDSESAVKRVHYILAEYVEWTYTDGSNRCYEIEFKGPGPDNTPGSNRATINGTFRKAIFRAYSDMSFRTTLPVEPRWEHLGILGPAILAEIGDTIEIFFMSKLDFPVNIQIYGLPPTGSTVGATGLIPGQILNYSWYVPDSASPGASDKQNSRLLLYRSTIDPISHENAGLAGPIIITRKGEAREDGSSMDVDRDIVTVFQVYNENLSPSSRVNLASPLNNGTDFFRKTINGYSWCNLPGLTLAYGERVRWHIAGLGSEEGLHSFHWHGNVFSQGGMRTDEFQTAPGGTIVAGGLTCYL